MPDPNTPTTLTLAYGALAGAASSVLITYLAKAFFEASIIRRVTGKIEHDFNKQLEDYKADLQSSLNQKHTILSLSFPKTAETIDALNKKLIALYKAVGSYVNLSEDASAQEREASQEYMHEKGEDCDEYFFSNRIYLPPEVAGSIYQLIWDLRMLRSASDILYMARKAQVHETVEKQHKKIDELNEKIPQEMAQMQEDFQRILRVIDEKKKTKP